MRWHTSRAICSDSYCPAHDDRAASCEAYALVGELSTRSDAFRVRWAAHDVRLHRTGLKHIRHPVVGELHLSYDVLELPADAGLSLIAFSAEAGSPDDDALRLLASWAATHNPANALAAPHQA